MYTPRFVYSFICGWTRVAIEHLFMCLLLFDCLLWRSEMKVAQLCPTLCNPMDCPWNSPGQNTGVVSLSLHQGSFPTQGLNPGHPHCRQILYQLSHKGSLRTLEWVAYPFSRGSSRPRNRNQGLQHCRQILYQLSYQGSPQ